MDFMRRSRGKSAVVHRQKSHTIEQAPPEVKQSWQEYSYGVGDDIEFKTDVQDAKKIKNKLEGLWFAMSDDNETLAEPNDPKKKRKPLRKCFVSFKVKRVSDIDNVKEQFRIKFHLYFNWLPTYIEYQSYIKAKKEKCLTDWKPQWYPHLEFMNQIDPISPFPKWESYPEEGCFRMQKFKKFFGDNKEWCDEKLSKFDHTKCYFIRAKYDVEMILSEELELQSFPFDCQDLSVIIREGSQDVKCVFLPELRKTKFGSIDPRYSVIDEWDMEAARIEFGTTNAGSSRSATKYPMILLRLKMKRRWGVYMWNVVFLMFCIESLGLCCFSLDIYEDPGDRLGLAMTLVLTAVAFLHVVKSNLPSVPYLTFLDKYVLSGYLFLIFIMLETAIVTRGLVGFKEGWDRNFMFLCLSYLIVYHVIFTWYALKVRADECEKLVMDSDEVEEEVNQSRAALKFDYTRGYRDGDNKRLLVFQAFDPNNKETNFKRKDTARKIEVEPESKVTKR